MNVRSLSKVDELLLEFRDRSLDVMLLCETWHDSDCQGYVPLTLDVVRVALKVPLAFHTPL